MCVRACITDTDRDRDRGTDRQTGRQTQRYLRGRGREEEKCAGGLVAELFAAVRIVALVFLVAHSSLQPILAHNGLVVGRPVSY